ncbi:hypothetical protein [Herbidospora mongoliensis]|uniref:hypothetical protein n=1 Tax=Herbidospora mongoliensis TaxID=688067 RepID=UPI000AC52D83|nr:hypothetical protein [Herbidospora mongoliensis]
MVVPYVLARSKELIKDPIKFVYSGGVYELVYAPAGRRSDVVMGVLRARVKTSRGVTRCGGWLTPFGSGAA